MKGTVTKRGKTSWRLKFDLAPDPAAGERRTTYKTFRGTKREAETELARLIAEAAEGRRVEPSKMTLAAFVNRWLAAAENTVSPKTREWHRYLAETHIAPRLGAVRLQDLTPLDVQHFIAELVANGRRDGKGGLAIRTVRHIVATLSQALRQAVQWGLIRENPVGRCTVPRLERQDVQVLDDEGLGRLLGVAASSPIYPAIVLAVATGMRRGEVLALRWQDLDLDAGVATVSRSLEQTKGGLRFKTPKTKTSRRKVRLPETLAALLRDHRTAQRRWRLAAGIGRDPEDLAFTTGRGGPFRPQDFSEAFAKLAAAAGVDCTFHQLRHAHASHLLRAGVPIQTVSSRLGHANASITLGVYSHLLPGMDDAAAIEAEATLRKAFGANPVPIREDGTPK